MNIKIHFVSIVLCVLGLLVYSLISIIGWTMRRLGMLTIQDPNRKSLVRGRNLMHAVSQFDDL